MADEDTSQDGFSSPSDDERFIHRDALPPMLLEVLFTQDAVDLVFQARFILVSFSDGSGTPVSSYQPVRIPLSRFHHSKQKIDAFIATVKNNLAAELPKVLAHTVGEEIKKSVNESAAVAGVSGDPAEVRVIGLNQRIKSDTKFQKRRAGVRPAGAPLQRTPAALRRLVKDTAIKLRRKRRGVIKLSDVAVELGRTESALSKEMERKRVSWRAIKAEVIIPT